MNRTIKFRGKRIDNGEWVYGSLYRGISPHDRQPYSIILTDEKYDAEGHLPKDIVLGFFNDEVFIIKANSVGQFTGLSDKNGNDIYEGDIVKIKEIGGYGMEYIGVVKYYNKDCRFGIDTTATKEFTERVLFTDGECSFNDGYCTITYINEYEVLGNIHDNIELLTKNE